MNGAGKKRVLVVDDDPIQLALVGAILKSDYDVVAIQSGSRALEHLSANPVPDLVLLDILMPEMDGFEVFEKIRTMESMLYVPVVFLTSVDGAEGARRALEKGAADYITKPYVMENFTNRIRNAIQVYEYKRRTGQTAAR